MTAATPGQTTRDLAAEEVTREFTGWMEAQGKPTYDCYDEYGWSDLADAFAAGMQAQRDLAAAAGDGTLRTRIKRLAETWEGHPELTEQGQILRDLGQILRDELGHASDAKPEPQTAPELTAAMKALAAEWVADAEHDQKRVRPTLISETRARTRRQCADELRKRATEVTDGTHA